MFLTLGTRFGLEDRGSRGQVSGWGIPRWGPRSIQGGGGQMKPMKVGARYFCGDCTEDNPVAMYDVWSSSKAEYQDKVTAHIQADHPDLHYPIDQVGIDAMLKAKRHAASILRTNADLKDLAKFQKLEGVGGGQDFSAGYRAVARPRELPDFTEFDFPDANVADGGVEELEFDQLISIAARQGRRFLGVELQGLLSEFTTEFNTSSEADLEILAELQLNTRTGTHNLDDPENLWRMSIAQILTFAGVTAAGLSGMFAIEENEAPVGGQVYVAPRLFWRFTNAMDRQVDTGDLFARIATISQKLSTFLLFELLEQYSGLFGFAA